MGLVAACSGSAATGGPPAGGTQALATQAAATQTAATHASASHSAPTQVVAGATGTAVAAGGAPKTPVACSLLTTAEAAAALGAAVNPGAGPVDPSENVCTFGGKALADMVNFVEIAVVAPVEFTPARAGVAGSFDIIPTTGIGDSAYYQKDYLPNNSGTRMSLSVQKGQTIFRIEIVHYGATDAQLKAAEKTLALAAAGRI